ncbi:AAA family ATPase [Nocardia sp. NPDC051030]|uniref:AAA family ATPase n=1 Tax=Nocardia sp. NPDC051030 TaxID=3155162 RepID=UPI0034463D3E
MEYLERPDVTQVLENLFANALDNRGRVVLIGGAPAIGKSDLLASFVESVVPQNALVLTATGSWMERDVPLGIVDQLIRSAPLADEVRSRALGFVDRQPYTPPDGTEILDRDEAREANFLSGALLDLAADRPLVIAIDDVHYSDWMTLKFLAYFCRRLRFSKVLVALTWSQVGAPDEGFFQSHFSTEVDRQPHCATLWVEPLSTSAVGAMVAERVDAPTADRLGSEWFALSGGNPILLRAALTDYLTSTHAAEAPETVCGGEHYGRAVVDCLHRGHPQELHIARGLAVLGRANGLATMLALSESAVQRSLRVLTATGVLSGSEFRSPAAASAILADLSAVGAGELRGRAAALEHESGAPATVVAEHLVLAEQFTEPWMAPVLQEAAGISMGAGRVAEALHFLLPARAHCHDSRRAAAILSMVARAQFQLNPESAVRYVDELIELIDQCLVSGADALTVVRILLWGGQFERAHGVLTRLCEPDFAAEGELFVELAITLPWITCTYPRFAAQLPQPAWPELENTRTGISINAGFRLESHWALSGLLSDALPDRALDELDSGLRLIRPDDTTIETMETALLALTYGGRPAAAARHCELLCAAASVRSVPGRATRMAAVRAEVALRQGDLAAAERFGRQALAALPTSSWGHAIGAPLATLVRALVAMGKLSDAKELLNLPVPPSMFDTRYGPQYLYARGRFSLANANPGAAYRDFTSCGEYLIDWKLDNPGFLPWRIDAAEACVELGRPQRALELIEEHLALCAPGVSRERGIALRARALASETRQRPPLLRRATEILRDSGDRYEFARSLVDLTATCHMLGDRRRAALIARMALSVAEECHAQGLISTLVGRGDATATTDSSPVTHNVLSDAEQRVASLAATGYTNREIAKELFITVSTVEQHLTRTYRKLDIARRVDLPNAMNLAVFAQLGARNSG